MSSSPSPKTAAATGPTRDRRATRRLAFGLGAAGVLALTGLAALQFAQHRGSPPAQAEQAEQALEGRVGSTVAWFDARYAAAPGEPPGRFRRLFVAPFGRLLLDLTEEGRVRQLTLGRERATNETFAPDPADWSLGTARELARPWLPRDAQLVRTEPFHFRGDVAGERELYRSAALGAVLPAQVYAQHGALGPPGTCAITYSQTSAGGVAFLLAGLY